MNMKLEGFDQSPWIVGIFFSTIKKLSEIKDSWLSHVRELLI